MECQLNFSGTFFSTPHLQEPIKLTLTHLYEKLKVHKNSLVNFAKKKKKGGDGQEEST